VSIGALRKEIEDGGLSFRYVEDVINRALEEDIGVGGDVTTLSTIPADLIGRADLVPRAPGVVAGLPIAALVFEILAPGRLRVEFGTLDGARVTPGEVLATVRGPVRDLLTAERAALNLLGHLSGIATATRRWVDAVAGTGALIRDTRKTTPGLRALEKYAVRAGGGVNHRMSLSDAALVKDNHVAAARGVARAFALVRDAYPALAIEVEVDTFGQAREVIDCGADLVLLDNMSAAEMTDAVAYGHARGARLEASGGLTLDRAAEVAATGVDYISVGALTHSAPVLDIGLDFVVGSRADGSGLEPDAAGGSREGDAG
jgi:nicotinate-nucleotide pyrophosphorylase (carboxylating)